MINFNDEDDSFGDMTLGALVDLRDQLINPINITSDYSKDLLETVDLALTKHLQNTIINIK